MSPYSTRRRFLATSAGLAAVGLTHPRATVIAKSAEVDAAVLSAKAVAFLRPRQGKEGGWSIQRGPGVSGVVVTALLRSKIVSPADPVVNRALGYLETFLSPKGGFAEGPQANYLTSIALMAFHEANTRGQFDSRIKAAQAYLKNLQWDEGEGKGRDDAYFGGAGYGGRSRPDLSNTSFFIEALKDSGLPADDPSLKRALVFVSRCQNLKSEFNDQPWADKVNDGGFIYTPAAGGVSMADDPNLPGGGLRSYASMTYAGLKSMIHAGLSPNDPRVKAAREYIRKHYTVDENPGLGQAGLFYYYQTFAKALSMLGDSAFVDAAGKSRDWRADLLQALAKRQAADGSWVNKADRFMEGDPNLVTAYGLLGLAYSRVRPEK